MKRFLAAVAVVFLFYGIGPKPAQMIRPGTDPSQGRLCPPPSPHYGCGARVVFTT